VRERIYIVGTDYRYHYANHRVIEFEGWNAQEVIGRHVVELVGALLFKRLVKPRLDRCFQGENVSFQHWVTTQNGQRQYIDVLLAPFRDWDETIIGSIVTIRDKTEQKELQEELRDQADLYRQLIENSLAGIAIVQDETMAFANQALATMFGYDGVDEMLRQEDPLRFVAEYDRMRVASGGNALSDGKAGTNQYYFDGVCKDGSVIHILASASRVYWLGRPACQLIAVDVTQQKRAEQALAATAASFRDVVEGSLQGFFALEGDRFVYINQAFSDLLGYSADELRLAPSHMFYAAHEQERMSGYRTRRLEQNIEPEIYEVDAVHKDGRIVRLQQCARHTDNWFGKSAILVFAIDVSHRHLTERKLEEERFLLRSIIDNIPAVVFAKDRQSRFLVKNKAGAAFVGEADPSHVIGKSNHDYYPAHLARKFRANELKVMRTAEPLIDDECEITCPATGQITSMNGCIAPLRNVDDEIIGIVGVSHDVSKHHRSEAALRESEQRFRDIAGVTSDWFWEMDSDLRFSYFSDRASELSSTKTGSVLGKKRQALVVEMNDEWRCHFDDLENHRPFRNFRYKRRGSDNRILHISISGVPIFDRDGDFKGYRGTGTNITKEVEAQEALAKERNLLRAVVDNIPDAIYAKDRQARFILKNMFDAKLMGAETPDETIGKTDFDYYPPALAKEFNQDDMQVIEEGAPIIGKVQQLAYTEEGEPLWYSTTKMPLRDAGGEIVGLVGIGRDITETKHLADRLQHQASHCSLTGLLNRGAFEHCLEEALKAAKSNKISSVLFYIDLDQFKMLNDTAGHMAGDQLLCQLADFFTEHTDAIGATLARLGGDEFGLLIDDCTLERGEKAAQDLIDALGDTHFSWEQESFSVGISVGITLINEGTRDISDVLGRADIACYAAKDSGRNRYRIYRSSDQETRERHEELLRAAGLKQAIENDGLMLVAQPIVRLGLGDQSISHYEILLRLKSEDSVYLPPGAFIPAAERYGLMSMIDQWVVQNTLEALRDVAGPVDGRRFNINLSGHSLADDAFQHQLRHMLKGTTIPADSLCFEITETAVISNLGRAKHFVGELRDMGCRIALDDFGCGLSSFSYLKQFPLDYIKIDGSFITNIAADETDRAIVEAINNVGHVCGLETVAECVEDEAQLGRLIDLQIDYAQGLAVGPPKPLSHVLADVQTCS